MKGNEWRARRAAALYRDGHPYTEIGKRLGISEATVFRDLKRSGIELRPRPQMLPQGITQRNREIADEYAKAGRLKPVAEKYGITEQAVWHHVRKTVRSS